MKSSGHRASNRVPVMKIIVCVLAFLFFGSMAAGMVWLSVEIIRRGGIEPFGVPDAVIVPMFAVILFSVAALLALFMPFLEERYERRVQSGVYDGLEPWQYLPWPLRVIPRRVRRAALSRASRRQRSLYGALRIGPHVVVLGSFLVLFAGTKYSLFEPLRTVEQVMHWVMTNSVLFFFVFLVITPCQVIRRVMMRQLVEAYVQGDMQAQRQPG